MISVQVVSAMGVCLNGCIGSRVFASSGRDCITVPSYVSKG